VIEPPHNWSWERRAEMAPEHPPDPVDVERLDGKPLHIFNLQRRLSRSDRCNEADWLAVEPPERECECGARRGVQPLHVVDRNDDQTGCCDLAQHVEDREGERARLDALLTLFEQERDPQRVPPRRNEPTYDVVHVGKQIAEGCETKARLRLGRPRDEHTVTSAPSLLDRCLPQRRLSDPRLALEHDPAESQGRVIEERI
jgi:hypothetical protein